MSKGTLQRRDSACQENNDPQKSRRNCHEYRFHQTEIYPSIRPWISRCDASKDVAINELANAPQSDGCGRPIVMIKDDGLLAWHQSPHKDTLSFYGVGLTAHQPESVKFNQLLAACLVKVSGGGIPRRSLKKSSSAPVKINPACSLLTSQICKPFILNRQALESELQQMPRVQQQLDPRKAFEDVYCTNPPDPSDPFGVTRQFGAVISRKQALDMVTKHRKGSFGRRRRRHWYCPMDCEKPGNKCTQYEWAKYKLDPRPYNNEFRDWLEAQKEQINREPRNYDELYERFLQCFEQKDSPDPDCQNYEKCCKPKKPKEEDFQGGGDGARDGDGGGGGGGGGGGVEVELGMDMDPQKLKGVLVSLINERTMTRLEYKDVEKEKDKNKEKEKDKSVKEEDKNKEKAQKDKQNTKDKNDKSKNTAKKDFMDEEEKEKSKKKKPRGSSVFSDKGRPSAVPDVMWDNYSEKPSEKPTVTGSETDFLKEWDKLHPPIPSKPSKKKRKKVKTKVQNEDKDKGEGRKPCDPCPPPGCKCAICHFMDRNYMEPEAPFMRDMRQAEKMRQLRAYYKQMRHRDYIQCRNGPENRAPRHNCDPIYCTKFFCRNPRLADHCDSLGAVQNLQKLLSVTNDSKDNCKLLQRVENLRRRLCQRICDCILP
ncbi:uncharacterized protein LOC108106861 [Drosophila eugracilis]|uniref:uncharacterized protein LOC108106861 n=1 Tax=Drosophila eugracilis TaxID=29029 RepID=UPI001BDA8104|nr:uncharacterized protein LOC108106861 [Drosophila eugracilis]